MQEVSAFTETISDPNGSGHSLSKRLLVRATAKIKLIHFPGRKQPN
jgi:hypothetical protein